MFKQLFNTVGLCSLSLLCQAQLSNFKAIKGDYLFMQDSEVSNESYLDFVNSQHLDKQKKLLPDTLVWNKMTDCEPMISTYLRHPAYGDYPVVGINHEQAKAYCLWLEEKYNRSLATNPKDPRKKIHLRLPNTQEWEMAALKGQAPSAIFPWEGHQLQIRKCSQLDKKSKARVGQHRANYLYSTDMGNITAPVRSYLPNPVGIYHLSGNVAELVEDPTIVKGGSWASHGYFLRIQSSEPYTEASPQVGFRPIAEVVEWKSTKSKPFKLTAKWIEKQLTYLSTNQFCGSTEVSNELYACFIQDLAKTNPQLSKQYTPQSKLWRKETGYHNFSAYHTQKEYAQHPVVNISHEAAQAFCKWLSKRYSELPGKKYAKLEFKLPSEKEWKAAAQNVGLFSYLDAEKPFKSYQLKNSKGCILVNYTPFEEQYRVNAGQTAEAFRYPNNDFSISRAADQVEFTAAIKAFAPSFNGAYCFLGNVAEMLSEKGISKGGSWNSTLPALQLDAQEPYTGPNPSTGFRFFVDVK